MSDSPITPTLTRPSKDALRKRGVSALRRARTASGGQKVSASALYEEIKKMQQDGLHMSEMSYALKRSERYIRMVKADHEATVRTVPKVKAGRTLGPDDDGYAETRFTTDAFVLFFERFSGKQFQEHCRPWVQAFVENRNVILNVPPRHAKSTIFCVWIPIWLVCIDRNVQILLISKTKDFAKGWATEIAGQLEMNNDLVSVFGSFEPDRRGDVAWRPSAGELIVRGRTRLVKGAQFTIESRGMEQQVLGKEADYVIGDDPTDQEVAESETKRETDLKHMREQVLTRIEPQITLDDQGNRIESQGGRAIIVGQRVHFKDMYGVLAAQTYERGPQKGEPLWHVERYPAIKVWPEDSPTGEAEVLWPARWTYDELMVSYERVGGLGPFSCLYQQQPMPDGASLATIEWLESCRDRTRDHGIGIRSETLNDTARWCSIDPSPSMWNALVVGDSIYSRDQWNASIIEIDRFKGGLHELIGKIQSAYIRHKFDYFIFEESGFARWFFEDPLFRSFKDRFKVIKHKTNINKNDREYGLRSMSADLEFNRISFPYGDAEGRAMTTLFETEALTYPEGDSDDVLMATWFPKWNWKKLRPVRHNAIHSNSIPWSFASRFDQGPDKEPVPYSFGRRRTS